MPVQNRQDHIHIPNPPLSIEVEYKAKSSYPLVKSKSPEGTIGSKIAPPIYSSEQNETWASLLEKHSTLAQSDKYLCAEYREGLSKLNLTKKTASHLNAVSEVLKNTTGWEVIRVEGLVPPEIFFKLLANKIFPCTDFIRHMDELDYTPAPDTFHDQIGHLPMITSPRFANFFQLLGIAGARAKNEQELEWINSIYWFTAEFGLINPTVNTSAYDPAASRIYGAGIASSCGEILYCLSTKVKKEPCNIEVVANTPFDIHHMQEKLFEISSFDDLENSFQAWAMKHGLLSV